MITILVLLSAAVVQGCYNPKVVSGKLRCAPGGECPDDFACVGGVCVSKGGGTAGVGAGGRGGQGSGGRGLAGSGGGGGSCATPVGPLCVTPGGGGAGACDPVCQTGCGCGLRCNVTPTGTGCMAVTGTKESGEICTPGADDCAPGFACLKERCGADLGRCYRFCRDNGMCGPMGVCGTPIELPGGGASGARACNLGDQVPACDVYARTGCPDPELVCYFVTSQSTKCDCPSGTNRLEGQNCSFYNDCAPGLTCLRTGGLSTCHRVCRGNADCTAGAACTISGTFGYCP